MPEKSSITRRGFLQNSGRLAAGALVAGAIPSPTTVRAASRRAAAPAGQAVGANDRINMGFIGVRGRGRDLYGYFGGLPGVRIAALCDIDQNVLAERAADVEKRFGEKPAVYQYQQDLLANKDIDAVAIATPNHWHALGTIWACQAGKHVYVEKPCCHTLFEGRRMVEAARRYGRMVAVGFQNRSIRSVRQAMAFLKSGGIGEVYAARRLVLQGARHHRSRPRRPRLRRPLQVFRLEQSRRELRPGLHGQRRLRRLARPGPEAAVQLQPLPLQLALALGLRRRRLRQPGAPSMGHRPLGARPERASPEDQLEGRLLRRKVRPGDPQHPSGRDDLSATAG